MPIFLIIGGGASGCFAAIQAKNSFPNTQVILVEKSPTLLGKVKVSGGGRCNVTHHCLEVNELLKFYPRGAKELNSPFRKWGVVQTIDWFEERGVPLKTEQDGRMFPITDSSQTIIDCLVGEIREKGVEIHTSTGVTDFYKGENGKWEIFCSNEKYFVADSLMIATGSSPTMWSLLEQKHHKIISPVPSLFTFHVKDARIEGLAGISLPQVEITIPNTNLKTQGAILITHWGLSGPSVLKLSAWGARFFAEHSYHCQIQINWLPHHNVDSLREAFRQTQFHSPKKQMTSFCPFSNIPLRLWKEWLKFLQIPEQQTYAQLSNAQLKSINELLLRTYFEIEGKSIFKEEFVTCGGVSLKEIDFKTMQSKIHPNLFFGGECLDIDAVTGGFNFQAAWTTGWIAGSSMGLVPQSA